MIRSIQIAAKNEIEPEAADPPERVLDLAVIGGVAHLDVHQVDHRGFVDHQAVSRVRVPARSLLIALQTAIDDDASNTP